MLATHLFLIAAASNLKMEIGDLVHKLPSNSSSKPIESNAILNIMKNKQLSICEHSHILIMLILSIENSESVLQICVRINWEVSFNTC